MNNSKAMRFDPELFDLVPHRPPMLLINRIESIEDTSSSATVLIDHETPFFEPDKGVPSWIGLEYMGQTAALIAGRQLKRGVLQAHLGILLGSRNYTAAQAYFSPAIDLRVACQQTAMVGESLVTFRCTIHSLDGKLPLAEASLSVLRNAADPNKTNP